MTKRNAVALLLGAGAVAVSTLNPLTGWLARLELRMLAAPAASALAGQSKLAAPASDPIAQLGTSSRATLPDIAKRFPENAAIQATALRLGLEKAALGTRPENYLESTKKAPAQTLPKSEEVADLLAQAERGARQEPENAYFPACRATVLLGANRDDEALAALHDAATKPHWDEHIADETRARWEVLERREGRAPALSLVAISAAALYPHYALLRSLARVVQAKAIAKEQAGDLKGGLALRTELMALGAHLRSDAPNLIGNLLGIAIHSIATSRPEGVSAPKKEKLRLAGESDEALDTRVQALRDTAWDTYVQRLRHPELVGASAKNAAFRSAFKGRMERVEEKNPMGLSRLLAVLKLEAAGLALVLSVLWVVLIGGLMQGLARTRRIREGQPLHRGVRMGLWLSLSLMPLIGVSVAHVGSEEVMVLAGAGTGLLTAALFYFQRRNLLTLLATVGSVYGILALCIAMGAGLLSLLQGFGDSGSAQAPSSNKVALLFSPLLLTVPLLAILVLALVGWRRRIPASVAVVRGFPKLALPLMAALLVAWAALLIPAAQEEASLRQGIDRGIQHEGRLIMQLSGEPWPGER